MHGGIRGLTFNVPSRPGWHRHHLIPREIYRYPDLGRFMANLEQHGLVVGDFDANGMFLPSDPVIARAARLPLHNGPHRTYNDMVIADLDRIRATVEKHRSGRSLAAWLGNYYQDRLRRALIRAGAKADVVLGSRDPFGPDPHLKAIDVTTDAMVVAAIGRLSSRAAGIRCSIAAA